MGRLIYLEAIIGAGKTTYAHEVGKRLNYRVFEEPVSQEHLTRFYSDPKRYAYQLQIYLLHKRIGIQMLAACEALYSTEYAGAIVDRSLEGDSVFEAMHYKAGNIDKLDHEAYLAARENMRLMIFPPTTLVYLDVQPATAFARIQERRKKEAREFEAGVTLEYLQSLRDHYRQMIKAAGRGRYPWSHAVDVQLVQWDPATRTPAEWDAVAASLAEEWR